MWDAYSGEDRRTSRSDIGRIARIAILAAMGIVIFIVAGNQLTNLLMNVSEFGGTYTKTLDYAVTSGLALAAIALVRVNFVSRHSVVWYALHMITAFVRRGDFGEARKPLRYSDFRMSPLSFGLWQVTKVVLLAPLFANLGFGMALAYLSSSPEGGQDLGLAAVQGIFGLPFADVLQDDGSFSRENVVPAIPALAILVLPLLGAAGMRLLLYVGVSGVVHVVSQYILDAGERKPKFLSYISTVEIIVGAAVFWAGFTIFFSSSIDFNTKYLIAGSLVLGAAFIAFGFFDKRRSRVMIYPTRRHVYARLLTAAAIVAIVGSIVVVNASIAGAKKVEYSGPYIAQEIAVNREMAGLGQVDVVNYDVKPPSVAPSAIRAIVDENRETLANIRLWDEEAATQKLKPELGQRNDISFADTDILRFGGTMYWTGITTPNLPDSLARGNEWFNQHFVYTHANPGFKMLEADTGNLVDEDRFFRQERVYYGLSGQSSGLFSTSWSAYPVGRESSDEIDQFFYNGTGGIDVAPPASWMFEPNFMLSYPDTPVHIMRYKDIHDRMDLLYPYFVYEFATADSAAPEFHKTGVIPVSDGTNTYWLMPLIVALDTSRVPWGSPFMLDLVGYALIDTYNGSVQVIVTGDDAFSEMFYSQYRDLGATREVPAWLGEQIRYPEEMFIWKISKFNKYHVTDPKTFIEARQFYDIPKDPARDVLPYYIITKPQGFSEPAFVGFQSLELAGSQTRNLVGYMIVENDLESLGRMTFYSVPLDSPTKLIGPTAAREALEKDREYKNIKTLLQGTPKVGENILYKIGDQEVYFIPVYTASNSGGVVSQIGTIAAVGASVTGTFYVGLGDTPVEAFENYLSKSAGQEPAGQPLESETVGQPGGSQDRVKAIEKMFEDAGVQVVRPTAVSVPLEFREADVKYHSEDDLQGVQQAVEEFVAKYSPEKVYEWQSKDGRVANFGVLILSDGIVENHYIAVEVVTSTSGSSSSSG
ncbi:MAG: UPF0182 family protein [Thermoproteota archaeon]